MEDILRDALNQELNIGDLVIYSQNGMHSIPGIYLGNSKVYINKLALCLNELGKVLKISTLDNILYYPNNASEEIKKIYSDLEQSLQKYIYYILKRQEGISTLKAGAIIEVYKKQPHIYLGNYSIKVQAKDIENPFAQTNNGLLFVSIMEACKHSCLYKNGRVLNLNDFEGESVSVYTEIIHEVDTIDTNIIREKLLKARHYRQFEGDNNYHRKSLTPKISSLRPEYVKFDKIIKQINVTEDISAWTGDYHMPLGDFEIQVAPSLVKIEDTIGKDLL